MGLGCFNLAIEILVVDRRIAEVADNLQSDPVSISQSRFLWWIEPASGDGSLQGFKTAISVTLDS